MYDPPLTTDGWILTELDVTDPDALFALLQDLLEVNPSEPAGAARHQHCRDPDKLRACRVGLFLWGRGRIRGPL